MIIHFKGYSVGKIFILAFFYLLRPLSEINAQEVFVTGAMKNVMWKGELGPVLNLDTVAHGNFYGLGPLEYLRGEVMVLQGVPYKSIVDDAGRIQVSTSHSNVPFFVYATVDNWEEFEIPEDVRSMKALETYLLKLKGDRKPFPFLLKGKIDSADLHIVNLPAGKIVSSPEDAHTGRFNFIVRNSQVEVLGFFSTRHQGIFTHHDTYIHMHLITAGKEIMGHVDALNWNSSHLRLLLPLSKEK